MRKMFLSVALALTVLVSVNAHGENWPQWRGPNQNGAAEGKGFPTKWGEEDGLLWKVKIPGWGTSTPVIWEEHIFLSCEDDAKNALVCLNRQGERRWLTHFGATAGNRNRKASGANPSPVTDGKHVFVYFRSGDVACVDFDGKVVWHSNLQEQHGRDQLWWDLGTSPVLTRKAMVIAVMHQGPSYLVALDKQTGKQLWQHEREVDAPGEARDSYTTPIVIKVAERETVLVLGADHVTAHDAANGKETWRVGGLNPNRRGNYRSISSPVLADDMLIAPYSRGATLTAIRLGGDGDVTKSHVAWTIDISAGDVPSPVSHDGKIYLCGDRGKVTCVEASSGKQLWTEDLPRSRYSFSSSPIVAGGNLYLTRENGTTYVLKLDDKPTLIATNVLRENTYATPVFIDAKIFLRTSDYLVCIGAQ